MNAIPNQRPTANELDEILGFWCNSFGSSYQEVEIFGYKRKEIVTIFKEANKEIPNISASYEKDPDAVYTSRVFTFNNLPKPVNSSVITSYLNEEENNKGTCIIFGIIIFKFTNFYFFSIDFQDSQIVDLDVLDHCN